MADTAVSKPPAPAVSFLLPAEGDVFYAPRVNVVLRFTGAPPSGMIGVLDGALLDNPIRIDKNSLTLNLTGLREGVHAFRLMHMDSTGRIRSTPTVRFFVRLPEPPPPPPPPKVKQFGRVTTRAEWRNDEAAGRTRSHSEVRALGTVAETDSTYAYDTLMLGGKEPVFARNLTGAAEVYYGARFERWEVDIKGMVSSNENRFRQPANRLSGSLSYGPWAYLKLGDVYPDYNPLIFNGARLRGGEAGVTMVRGEEEARWAYAKVAVGETQRLVPAYIVRSSLNGVMDTAYVPGTHAQSLRAFRVGAGGGDRFDIGITLMKAVEIRSDSTAESVNEYLYGAPPGENLVGGLDARLGLWEGRVQLYGQGALSFYTSDRSLGPFNNDTTGEFEPGRYRRILVINPTTNGWEYLVTDSGTPDYKGFVDASSTYSGGVSVSIPLRLAVWETDLSYSHLGSAYRSEANPFLGSNPGNGWRLQQRLGFLENRLHFGAEASTFLQEFESYRQRERGVKTEAKFTTSEQLSSIWVNGGVSRNAPEGGTIAAGSAYEGYFQDFDEFNLGGSHQEPAGPGSLHLLAQYGFTRGAFRLRDPDASLYPAIYTHVFSSSLLYKFLESDFVPKLSHTYSDNGVQRPVNTVGAGFQNSWLEKKLRLDANVLTGTSAKSPGSNGTSFTQNCALTLRLPDHQMVRLSEKSSHYGERGSVIAGAHYERTF